MAALRDHKCLFLAIVVGLAGCGEPASEAEAARWDAALACVERAEPLLDQFEQDNAELRDALGSEGDWRVGEDGHFVAEILDPRAERTASFLLTCAGNVDARRIDLVQVGESEIRPAEGEIWSY